MPRRPAVLDIDDELIVEGNYPPALDDLVNLPVPAKHSDLDFNPASLGFPPMLPIELAMRTDTPRNICESYGIDREEFAKLIDNPVFNAAYEQAQKELQKDGVGFRKRAQMQAEHLLAKSWQLIHSNDTPRAVQADLIKSTVKWAGYEPKGDAPGLAPGSAFQININLG